MRVFALRFEQQGFSPPVQGPGKDGMIKPQNMKNLKASTFSGREAFEPVEVKIVSLTSQHVLCASPEPTAVGGLTLQTYNDGGVF